MRRFVAWWGAFACTPDPIDLPGAAAERRPAPDEPRRSCVGGRHRAGGRVPGQRVRTAQARPRLPRRRLRQRRTDGRVRGQSGRPFAHSPQRDGARWAAPLRAGPSPGGGRHLLGRSGRRSGQRRRRRHLRQRWGQRATAFRRAVREPTRGGRRAVLPQGSAVRRHQGARPRGLGRAHSELQRQCSHAGRRSGWLARHLREQLPARAH